jgi:obg-like ATPase 1
MAVRSNIFESSCVVTNTEPDFEKTFIQCIVYNYKSLREEGDEAAVRAKGKIMTKGKDYVVEDGDILLIKAGAAKG